MARRNQLRHVNRRYLVLIVAAVLSLATFVQQQQPQHGSRSGPNQATNLTVGFRSQQRLDDHYAKHGKEFGNITKAKYLLLAQQLRDAPLSNNVIEGNQARGNMARFDKSSGAFLAFDDRKIIQTFFKPNGGEAYFRRATKPSS